MFMFSFGTFGTYLQLNVSYLISLIKTHIFFSHFILSDSSGIEYIQCTQNNLFNVGFNSLKTFLFTYSCNRQRFFVMTKMITSFTVGNPSIWATTHLKKKNSFSLSNVFLNTYPYCLKFVFDNRQLRTL